MSVTIQTAIQRGIQLLGRAWLQNPKLVLRVLEDLAPDLTESRRFIEAHYDERLGKLFCSVGNTPVQEREKRFREADTYLREKKKLSYPERKQLLGYFEQPVFCTSNLTAQCIEPDAAPARPAPQPAPPPKPAERTRKIEAPQPNAPAETQSEVSVSSPGRPQHTDPSVRREPPANGTNPQQQNPYGSRRRPVTHKRGIFRIAVLVLIVIVLLTYALRYAIIQNRGIHEETDSASVSERQTGDINGDGAVDQSDLDMLNAYLVKERELSSTQLQYADFNGDGEVNVADARKLTIYLEGKK